MRIYHVRTFLASSLLSSPRTEEQDSEISFEEGYFQDRVKLFTMSFNEESFLSRLRKYVNFYSCLLGVDLTSGNILSNLIFFQNSVFLHCFVHIPGIRTLCVKRYIDTKSA